eukprot:m.41948 g.41948  ORF g.41948 m.41948 type:complete len:531 (-) comp10582_c0_seq2:40-1632(-)
MALPIHLAAQRGLTEAVRLLVTKGASVDLCDDNGYTALHLAAHQGHVAVVELLLQLGANPENQGPEEGDRYSALHLAAQEGHVAVAEALLRASPEIVDLQTDGGDTALHLAVRNGKGDMVECLLAHGARMDLRDEEGCSAMQATDDLEIRAILLKYRSTNTLSTHSLNSSAGAGNLHAHPHHHTSQSHATRQSAASPSSRAPSDMRTSTVPLALKASVDSHHRSSSAEPAADTDTTATRFNAHVSLSSSLGPPSHNSPIIGGPASNASSRGSPLASAAHSPVTARRDVHLEGTRVSEPAINHLTQTSTQRLGAGPGLVKSKSSPLLERRLFGESQAGLQGAHQSAASDLATTADHEERTGYSQSGFDSHEEEEGDGGFQHHTFPQGSVPDESESEAHVDVESMSPEELRRALLRERARADRALQARQAAEFESSQLKRHVVALEREVQFLRRQLEGNEEDEQWDGEALGFDQQQPPSNEAQLDVDTHQADTGPDSSSLPRENEQVGEGIVEGASGGDVAVLGNREVDVSY